MKVKYYFTSSGRSPVEELLRELSQELKDDFLDAIILLEQGENLSMPFSRNLSSIFRGLHELRLKDRSGAFRFFYFIKRVMRFTWFMLLRRRLKSCRKRKLK